MSKPNCYKCVYRSDIPGDAHSSCRNFVAKVSGNEHGILKGWFTWPINFDPVWLESCDGFKDKDKYEIINITQYIHPKGKKKNTQLPVSKRIYEMAKDQILTCECMPNDYNKVVFYSRKKDWKLEDEVCMIAYNNKLGKDGVEETMEKLINKVHNSN